MIENGVIFGTNYVYKQIVLYLLKQKLLHFFPSPKEDVTEKAHKHKKDCRRHEKNYNIKIQLAH